MRRLFAAALLLAFPAGCEKPPATAYVGGHNTVAIALGTNAVGETCTQNAGAGAREASIFCGTWDQPAGHVIGGDTAAEDRLPALVAASAWRVALDRRVACDETPAETEILGQKALLLHCTRRLGGWPHLAVATIIDGHAWYADGVEPSLPAMERGIGVLSGRLSGDAVAQHAISPALAAQRLASATFSASDIGQYETWMRTASIANRAGSYADAEAADRAIAALQRRVLGPQAPALSRTLASQAVQDSNLGRYAAAEALLDQAERLAHDPNQTDENAVALVWHDRGLHLLNQHRPEAALAMLQQSEAAYTVNLHGAPLIPAATNFGASPAQRALAKTDLINDAPATAALRGIIETKRTEAVALERLHRLPESQVAAATALELARARGLDAPGTSARLLRTSYFVAEAQGRGDVSLPELQSATLAFGASLPGSVAYAKTMLLLAQRQARSGGADVALATCRTGIAALRAAGLGIEPTLLLPCLSLMNDAAIAGAKADALHAEMFETAELAQGSTTSKQIAEASARLSENARDPHVADLIRARADLTAHLADLTAQLPDADGSAHEPASADTVALQKSIAAIASDLAEKSSALQAASPNYASLTQTVVGVNEITAALRPGEAFVSIVLGPDSGWSLLVRDGHVSVAPIAGGSARMAALVAGVRSSLDTAAEPPPPFDIAAASELYQVLLGGFGTGLDNLTALTVAPSGPLLSLPFGLLLTGPARQDALADAPWLVQRLVISHVPAPANFVRLRKLAGTSRATKPWFGFGDFRPVSLTQAQATFPIASCGDSAALLSGLPPLPGAQLELQTVRQLTQASAADQLLGANFTAESVMRADLKPVRILHFATHALISTDLKCQTEPALITSAPRNAPTAAGALLTASDVRQLDLDADAVILSACNTGGALDGAAGESLSGLARSFFYAGARAVIVTHWDVNDRVTAYLVSLAIANSRQNPSMGIAGGLAAAQRSLISDARGDLAGQAHPFYWAPLALIGDGIGDGIAMRAEASTQRNSF